MYQDYTNNFDISFFNYTHELVIGLGDHNGWFKELLNFFVNNNFAVLTFDLRGHGKSDGKRGHIPSCEALMNGL